ncbi:hypothetical protein [Pseudomonas corrugata]|uniref:hypothetical protein n=1 Tax=Pseudomonas corrugata TaxID=47879 RepID=UPI0006D89850|nr:hypothetical protein [Pseudomonas corrugata]
MITLLQEVKASADWTKELHKRNPQLPLAVSAYLEGVAVLLDDVATKLKSLKALRRGVIRVN